MKQITGIVLTGGKSRRFKSDKTFAIYQKQSFYQQMLQLMDPFVDHIYIVRRSDQPINAESDKISLVTDVEKFKGDGPLAGIYTALNLSSSEWFLVMPVDTPLMKEVILSRMIRCCTNEKDAVIPRINGKVQPLIGLYHAETKPIMKQQLESNQRSMHQFLAKLNVKYIDFPSEDEKFFANINTREEYQQFLSE